MKDAEEPLCFPRNTDERLGFIDAHRNWLVDHDIAARCQCLLRYGEVRGVRRCHDDEIRSADQLVK